MGRPRPATLRRSLRPFAGGAFAVAGDRELGAVHPQGVGGEAAAEAVAVLGPAEAPTPAHLVSLQGATQDGERRQGPALASSELDLSHGRQFDPPTGS